MVLKVILPTVSSSQYGAKSNRQLSVIPIVGRAGVGKTALVQVIYNEPNVKEPFGLRGCLYGSSSCDSRDIAKDIIKSFGTEQQGNIQTISGSSERILSNIIQNKKFLLVLDNLQDNVRRIWSHLSSILAGGANGSVVLLTTQSQEVAKSIGTTAHIKLGHLSFPILCRVFEHHAFGKQKKASLESIGKQVVQNLHGLPLLAEAIGRLLRQVI